MLSRQTAARPPCSPGSIHPTDCLFRADHKNVSTLPISQGAVAYLLERIVHLVERRPRERFYFVYLLERSLADAQRKGAYSK